MGPRRRGKGAASSARNAAIQAVKRQRQQDDEYDEEEDNEVEQQQQQQQQQRRNNVASSQAAPENVARQPGNSQAMVPSPGTALSSQDQPPPLIDDDASIIDNCLHCHNYANDVQVRCDECHAYICQTCHWCHEFQANHEIRVCDRCDAFYCRNCDEMDQCDDCGEVVCASCSTLLSCKFCGGGLCEECATACGRCGIVLCSRDAKFAVDCDTCRLSYCLVCLASGSKEPCVRCGHRPSKRMEQLVHLRLKSIYKAFKQSSRPPNSKDGGGKINFSSNTPEFITDGDDDDGILGDVDNPHLLLQAAASAASSSAKALRHQHSSNHHHHHHSHHHPPPNDHHTNSYEKEIPAGGLTTTDQARELVDRYMEEKEKADAAAEALLAELEEEEEAIKSKKSKKKRKKNRQQQAKQNDDKKEPPPPDSPEPPAESPMKPDTPPPAKPTKSSKKKLKNSKPTPPKQQSAPPAEPLTDSGDDEEWMVLKGKHSKLAEASEPQPDELERRLADFIGRNDTEGIEEILFTVKGVPGRSALRKNAKKALKRIRQAEEDLAMAKAASEASTAGRNKPAPIVHAPRPDPFTKVQQPRRDSNNHNPGLRVEPTKTEFVMRVSPFMVGWIIGRGGQRIRDLMEESGAKIWIDQNNASAQDQRSVYVNGTQKCVDHASRLLKDLIANGPPAGPPEVLPPPAPMSIPVLAPPAPKPVAPVSPVQVSQIGNPAVLAAVKAPPGTIPPIHATIPPESVAEKVVPNADETMYVIECEPRFVPLLIGRRGWAIKNIQDTSGARVDIDQSTSPRKIRISGKEANVQVAVRMVNDVLRYPPAQLQLDEQDLEPSSPPSSLIMTGDPKTSVSASSSLSSTPEPSVSNARLPYGHLQTGVLFPNGYDIHGVVGSGSFVPPAASNIPMMPSNLSQPTPSLSRDEPLFTGGLGGMATAPHGQNYSLPTSYDHQHRPSSYASPHIERTTLNPNPFADDFRGQSSPSPLSGVNTLGIGNLSSALANNPAPPNGVPWAQPDPFFVPPQPSMSNDFGIGGDTLHSRLPINGQTKAYSDNPFASNSPVKSPGGFNDDSHIVDSLFATTDVDNTQSLLSGLQGLSIDADSGGEVEGMWGTSLATGWRPESDPVAPVPDATDGSILLAGLQSLNADMNKADEVEEYYPLQSRFHWGASPNNKKNGTNGESIGRV